jgi:hypothetical protein
MRLDRAGATDVPREFVRKSLLRAPSLERFCHPTVQFLRMVFASS